MTLFTGDDALAAAADQRIGHLRSPALVMQPAALGAARLTKHSFSRSMLRHASDRGWTGQRTMFNMDDLGQGEVMYEINTAEINTGEQVLSFIGFTQVIDEAQHTDRVIGGAWEITGALVDGPVDAALMDELRANVPLQERGRFGPDVLVLTRGKPHKTDDVIDAVAPGGGIIGCTLYPLFMGGADVTRRQYCQMLADLAERIGADHVAIGSDAVLGWQSDALGWMRSGRWDRHTAPAEVPDFPPWPAWFDGPKDFPSLAAGLDEVGFSPAERDAVLGNNWLRMFGEVFT